MKREPPTPAHTVDTSFIIAPLGKLASKGRLLEGTQNKSREMHSGKGVAMTRVSRVYNLTLLALRAVFGVCLGVAQTSHWPRLI